MKFGNNILAINPPIEDFTAYNVWAAPIGLFKVLASLKSEGKTVRYIDLLDAPDLKVDGAKPPKFRADGRHSYWKTEIQKPEEIKFVRRRYFRFGATDEMIRTILASAYANTEKPDTILISSGMTYWYRTVIKTAQIAKELFPGVPVITGGIAASIMPQIFENNGVTVWRGKYREQSRYSEFKEYLTDLHAFPAQLIEGCPNRCEYCASGFLNPKVRYIDIKDEAACLDEWADNTGRNDVVFFDDALLLDKGSHLIKFIGFLKNKYRFHLPNGLHLKEIHNELAACLKANGFDELRFGFETVSSKYDNKKNIDMLHEKLALLRDAGFSPAQLGVYILCGMPGQTIDEIEETLDIIMKAGGRPYLNEYSPVPGTALFNEHAKECRFDIAGEPLYQNNTISGYRSSVFTYSVVTRIKEQLANIYRSQVEDHNKSE